MPSALFLYTSSHHGNTRKLVEFVASSLGARAVDLLRSAPPPLGDEELIVLASGVYFQTLSKPLLAYIQSNAFAGRRVAILYTCGLPLGDYAKEAAGLLQKQGAIYLGSHGCRGFDSFGPLRYIGGIAKGRPNEADLRCALAFVSGLLRDASQPG